MAVIRIKNKDTPTGVPTGLTQGELAVNLADRSLYVGGTDSNAIFISGVQSFNGATGAIEGASLGANTFDGLNQFQAGISAAGATLGTLIVHNGISASGGVTFHNNLYVGGGASFGNSIDVESDISFGGDLKKSGQTVNLISVYGSTASLPRPGLEGEVAFVNGASTGFPNNNALNGYGLYLWDGGFSFEYEEVRGAWIRITNAQGYLNNTDVNGDGVVDGLDLAFMLAAWGASGAEYSQGGSQSLLMGIGDGLGNAFEVKVFGISTEKKASVFRITSNDSVPQIFMKAGTVEMDSDLVIYPVGDYTTTIKQTGFMETGYLHVLGSTAGGKGSTYDGNLYVGGLLTLNGGLSAGCGVTFNCLTHFTQGLSASGATLGTLVVNGGSTFNGPVYMGATLTMNSNIRFNTGYGISGGFIDAGWY